MADQGESGLRSVKGIGPKKREVLHRLGIDSLDDMRVYYPRDHERWEYISRIKEIPVEGQIIVRGAFTGEARTLRIKKGLTITRRLLHDESGSIECVWYNQPYRAGQYQAGIVYGVMGTVNHRRRQIINPRILPSDQIGDGPKILPVYPSTDGITQNELRALAQKSLEQPNTIQETLPQSIRSRYGLWGIREALSQIHFPEDEQSLIKAKTRIIFEEFFWYQLALAHMRSRRQSGAGPNCPLAAEDVEAFTTSMPFCLTNAQRRTIAEITEDLSRTCSMNRLVHGDVGSGKTVIAAFCLYAAWKNGYQGAIMAPTEILARQLGCVLERLLAPFSARVASLTGSQTTQEKAKIKDGLASGEIDIVAGTHALIQEDVSFHNLGMVITDEQHRFGVRQRTALKAKSGDAHMLVMSATPIPRTMALLLFGDLDVSTLDEMPSGRKPIRTDFVDMRYRDRIYRFIRERVKNGEQAYIICPLIEESEALEAAAAVSYYERLKKGPFADIHLGLLHGRMKPAEKDAVMEGFAEGKISVLVSTTVVEVGVDVPRATVMVIENAERFGLAQLHQLRGRVGRSDRQSYCILVSDTANEDTKKRLSFLAQTTDGFAISEEDLKMRGPGDFFGTRQHGIPAFRLADPIHHMELLGNAAQAAREILDGSFGESAGLIEEARMRMAQKYVSMN